MLFVTRLFTKGRPAEYNAVSILAIVSFSGYGACNK